MHSYPTLLVEQDGPVVTVTMNRPEKLNTADIQMYLDLEALMPRLSADTSVRAIILTGAGSKAFAAGDDIGIFTFDVVEGALGFIDLVNRAFAYVEQCPKPIIGAINGYALGYGFELALACDMVLAADHARLGLPEITVGAVPINTVTRGLEVLRRRIVSHLSLSGADWLHARQAEEMGLVSAVLPFDQLLPTARRLAARVAQWDAAAVAAVKRLLNRRADLHYRYVVDIMPAVMFDAEVREGRAAFLAKRPPRFSGDLMPDLD